MLSYNTISGIEAYKLMNTRSNVLILDVRTLEEYKNSHIENSILIPVNEIYERVELEILDKYQTILIYCEKGFRSRIAAMLLCDLNYKNIYDFGGLLDWPYAVSHYENKKK